MKIFVIIFLLLLPITALAELSDVSVTLGSTSTVNMDGTHSIQVIPPGTTSTYSVEQTTGAIADAIGNMQMTYSGLTLLTVMSGNGRYSLASSNFNTPLYGISHQSTQIYQSLISPLYWTVASAYTTCPSAQNYNWLLVRARTPALSRNAMDATQSSFYVGGTLTYNPSASPFFNSTGFFNLQGTVYMSAFGIDSYPWGEAECSSGKPCGADLRARHIG